jgi:uncharacterized protein YdeI (YjbR/CyaY-like superfamily)
MITDADDYFARGCGRCDRFATPGCATRVWLPGLLALRRLCLAAGLTETAKWGHPCYVHAGRNIAILGAFRGDFRLTFFDAALLSDPEGVLERQGPNTRHPDCLRFTNPAGPAQAEPAILGLLAQAMEVARRGLRPPKDAAEADLPAELVTALDADPALAGAFSALTPGRQKSWVLHLSDAKASATRVSRIEKGRAKIMAGKGALER